MWVLVYVRFKVFHLVFHSFNCFVFVVENKYFMVFILKNLLTILCLFSRMFHNMLPRFENLVFVNFCLRYFWVLKWKLILRFELSENLCFEYYTITVVSTSCLFLLFCRRYFSSVRHGFCDPQHILCEQCFQQSFFSKSCVGGRVKDLLFVITILETTE